MTAILILNWNGWQDTIDCLKSLSAMTTEEYFVVLGDNGSSDDSLSKLIEYTTSKNQRVLNTDYNENKKFSISPRDIIIYDLKENHGFAKGNNYMVKYAHQYDPEYYLLLNNDTEVEEDFLEKLVSFKMSNEKYKVLTPLIHYYFDKSLIWNAGGNLIWGGRKYHYADKPRETLKENDYIDCTYITGCALFCDSTVLLPDNSLLTERFFHGEEDFEFGHRMRKQCVKMACVINSVIYHKVGRSCEKAGKTIGLMYIHFLNRFIDLRTQLNPFSYYAYLIVYTPQLFRLVLRNGLSFRDAISFYRKLLGEIHTLDSVPKEKFLKEMKYYQ